ncbi:Uncharacterised protein [Corynebacterium striatum]|uniref:Uncharacterized protein n=1 Tax=Corynebacterium striatum TaxID=43770 RepID=A0AAQ1Z6E1_CORST|nr:hypothetical protein [Corynebacterium striatum]EEI78375.1 hypothetical protein HMPREF0308_1349 [Corynebacterium striatum ATCC 6940]QQE52577.1 hypothetical protein I6I11_10770 [Corynebacterium striatum]GEA42705.1 hypothetical protein Cst04h_08750 [Corynebacterium striatum]STD56950.1 Uncharacterised protein [Corynebacterium striatum]
MTSKQKKEMSLAIASFILVCIAFGGILSIDFSFTTVVIGIAWLVTTIIAFRKIRQIQKEQAIGKRQSSS